MCCISSLPYVWNETFPKGNAQFCIVVLGTAISGAGFVSTVGGASKVIRKFSIWNFVKIQGYKAAQLWKEYQENAFAILGFPTLVWRKWKGVIYSSHDNVANSRSGDRYWVDTLYDPELRKHNKTEHSVVCSSSFGIYNMLIKSN